MPDGSPKRLSDRDRIARDLRRRIRSGELSVGDTIGTGRELAEHYQVSHSTVEKTLRALKTEGTLVGHPGKAVIVAAIPENDPPARPATLAELAREVEDLKARVSDLEQRGR